MSANELLCLHACLIEDGRTIVALVTNESISCHCQPQRQQPQN